MRCQVASECLTDCMGAVFDTYVRYILNKKPDHWGTEDVVDVCKILVRSLDGFRDIMPMRFWKTPDTRCSVHMLSIKVAHFISKCLWILFKKGRQILLNQWSSTWLVWFHDLNAGILLAVGRCHTVAMFGRSCFAQIYGGWEVLAARPLGRKSIIGYWYGSLVYEVLSSSFSQFKMYGENTMNFTTDAFSKWAVRLPETASGRTLVQHPVWEVPAPFRAKHYVNDGIFLLGDEAPDGKKQRKEGMNNVGPYQIASKSSAASFRSCKLLAVRVLPNSKYGEELFVNYDNNYEFDWWNIKWTLSVYTSFRENTLIVDCNVGSYKFD